MNFEGWKEKYYPKPANETTPEEALDHSLRKWEGALPENAEEFGLSFTRGTMIDGKADWSRAADLLTFDSESCSLCRHHVLPKEIRGSLANRCDTCPITIYKNATGDYYYEEDQPCNPEYDNAVYDGYLDEMVELLRNVKAYMEENK